MGMGPLNEILVAVCEDDVIERQDWNSRAAPSSRGEAVIEDLAVYLYEKYYADSDQRKYEAYRNDDRMIDDNVLFLSTLIGANAGTGYFEPGWLIVGEDSGGEELDVRKGDITLRVKRRQHFASEAMTMTVGDTVSVRFPKDNANLFNGYYYAYGDVHYHHTPRYGVRMYFNVDFRGAAELTGVLTRTLNDHGAAFHFKTPGWPEGYQRRDTAVLYFDKRIYMGLKPKLLEVWGKCRSLFSPETPFLTKMIRPGVAVAEEPNFSRGKMRHSFGMSRCLLIAESLLKSNQEGLKRSSDRYAGIVRAFEAKGLDVEYPYLNPGSQDRY